MLQMQIAIEQHSALLKRDAAVRIKLWLTKLGEQVSPAVCKRAANCAFHAVLKQGLQQCMYAHSSYPSSAVLLLDLKLTTLSLAITFLSLLSRHLC